MGLSHVIWRRSPRCAFDRADPKIETTLVVEVTSLLMQTVSSVRGLPTCRLIIDRGDPLTICVGGITLGGAGKTPVVEYMARAFLSAGLRVGVLAHGYRSQQNFKRPVEIPNPIWSGDLSFGDEASMLRRMLPDQCQIWVGGTWRQRWTCAQTRDVEVIICDGGLYTDDLPRHLGVIVAPTQLKPRLIPCGDLTRPHHRWPRSAGYLYWWIDHTLHHSSRSIPTRPHLHFSPHPSLRSERTDTLGDIPTLNPQLLSHLCALDWINKHGARQRLEHFQEARAGMLCAIARPERFSRALDTLGLCIEQSIILRDHQAISRSLYRRLDRRPLWFTTLKDLVKLKNESFVSEIWALQTQLSPPQPLNIPLRTPHSTGEVAR